MNSRDSVSRAPFVFATFGTTSAGKSTFLNALLGGPYLPSDADELSAGMLRLYHAPLRGRFSIGDEVDMSFKIRPHHSQAIEGVRDGISLILRDFRKRRIANGYAKAPDYPVMDLGVDLSQIMNLFGLTKHQNLGFVDLPGLRAEKDEQNHRLIRSTASYAYPIFIVDYLNLHSYELLESLLMTLKEESPWIERRRPPLFVLNKADRRASHDDDIATYKGKLKERILETIQVNDFDIIPMSGRLFADSLAMKRLLDSPRLHKTWWLGAKRDSIEPGSLIYEAAQALHSNSFHDIEKLLFIEDYDEVVLDRLATISKALRRTVPLSMQELEWLTEISIKASGGARFIARAQEIVGAQFES